MGEIHAHIISFCLQSRNKPLLKTTRTLGMCTAAAWVGLVAICQLNAQTPEASPIPRWAELTPQAHEKMIAKLKAFSEETRGKLNDSLRLLETKFFLFYTDLTPAEARKWAYLLDKMYHRLCKLFGVEKGTNIWHGKALIMVFTQEQDYHRFWRTMLDVDSTKSAGMCHGRSDGQVIIAFYRQPEEMDFAKLLVHESVHGFLHRYRSPIHIISWANEGLAEVISYELVPKSQSVPTRQRYAKAELKKRGNMGGDFFSAKQIDGWQYGVASGLTAYMIKQRKKGYVAFINGIKDGQPWRESFKKNYGVPLERLVHFYGKSMGIKSLVP